jgi:hypothetical protein
MLGGRKHFSNRVVFQFFGGFRFALHSKEYHLLLPHLLDLLSGEDTSDATLNIFSSSSFLLLRRGVIDFSFLDFLFVFQRKFVLSKLLLNLVVTESTLASTLVLLDKSDSAYNLHIESEGIVNDFFNRVRALVHSWFRLVLI